MLEERNRSRRLAAEAKAITKKANRNGGTVSTRDLQRLTRVNGSLVKYSVRDSYDNQDDYDPEN